MQGRVRVHVHAQMHAILVCAMHWAGIFGTLSNGTSLGSRMIFRGSPFWVTEHDLNVVVECDAHGRGILPYVT